MRRSPLSALSVKGALTVQLLGARPLVAPEVEMRLLPAGVRHCEGTVAKNLRILRDWGLMAVAGIGVPDLKNCPVTGFCTSVVSTGVPVEVPIPISVSVGTVRTTVGVSVWRKP